MKFKGAPYKYGVAQASRGFDEAPVVILKALKRLTWAGQLATASATEISEEYHDPNELLTIGYFEDSTIGVCASWRLVECLILTLVVS
jgi:hypothetical protein